MKQGGKMQLSRQNLKLPTLPMAWKWPLSCLGIFAFFYVYGKAAAVPHPQLLPLTWLDQATPLLPWTVLIYLSDYLYILLLIALFRRKDLYSKACYGVLFGVLISVSIFHIYPTTYPRMTEAIEQPWGWLFAFLHGFDAPSNCLPSLHVSNTLTPTWYLVQQDEKRPKFHSLLWLWSIAICLSTVTTKQHYAVDILGGVCVSLLSIGLVRLMGVQDASPQTALSTSESTLDQDSRKVS